MSFSILQASFSNVLTTILVIFITMSTGEIRLENHISSQDLEVLFREDRFGILKYGTGLRKNPFGMLTEAICIGNNMLQALLPSMFPSETDPEVIYYLYYRTLKPDVVKPSDKHLFQKVLLSLRNQPNTLNFNPKRNITLIVHGFMSHGNATWVLDMVSSLLHWADLNVVVVDWSASGATWKYWQAVKQISVVGDSINKFFQWLYSRYRTKPLYIHCIGHSLGSHICGDASYKYSVFHRITGLDPALPCFKDVGENKRLDANDAEYVDVIHTNAPREVPFTVRLGLPMPIGSSDFFPNGGDIQPGCRYLQTREKKSDDLGEAIEEAICSHGRSYEYFTDSIKHAKNMDCTFMAHEWDNKKEIPQRVSQCNRSICPQMGINAIGGYGLPQAQGTYYVRTRHAKPYCIKTEVGMIDGGPHIIPYIMVKVFFIHCVLALF